MNFELIKERVNNPDLSFTPNGFAIIEGQSFKLTPWRYDIFLKAVHTLSVEWNSLDKICSYKANIVESEKADLRELLYAELDTCEWLLDDRIKTVYALSSKQTVSAVLTTEKGILCSLDIATTLSNESTPVIRHEIVGKEGVISDRSITERIPSMPTYVFTNDKKHPESYDDMNLYIDGLTPRETYAFENVKDLLAYKDLRKEAFQRNLRLSKLTDCINRSLKSGKAEKMEV